MDVNASVALYAVGSDVEGAKIAKETGAKATDAVVAVLKAAWNRLTTDPQLVASMPQGRDGRSELEAAGSDAAQRQYGLLRRERIVVACASVNACSTHGKTWPIAGALRP